MTLPIFDVISAIEAPTTRHTRRVMIYESDGKTVWEKPGDESRLIDGSVSVDYSREERRVFDLTLDNTDGLLAHDPTNGLWYDKIIKIYRGVDYDVVRSQPRILIVQDGATRIARELRNLGFSSTFMNKNPASVFDLDDYDVILADAGSEMVSASVAALLVQAYGRGKNILTIGKKNSQTEVPWITASMTKAADAANWAMTRVPYDTSLVGGWGDVASFGYANQGILPTALASTATPVATFTYSGTIGYVAAVNVSTDKARWFQLTISEQWEANVRQLLRNAVTWLFNYQSRRSYEIQLGEFMIDRIDEDWFPDQVKITGRDYTKRMLGSKISQAVTFSAGTDVGNLVKAIASNAGVTKFNIASGGVPLTADVSFERSTERWKMVSDVCVAYGMELFFNRYGALTMRPFRDPVTSPTLLTLQTGKSGNLVSYSKSSNDSRIYNWVTVVSDDQDAVGAGLLPFAEARNVEPSSPTRIERLGARVLPITTSVATTVEQLQKIADARLKIAALESFELSFSSYLYPWLEVGNILEFIDPKAGVGEPTRFLMDTLALPLTLGPMSGTGKRITVVGGGSVPGASIFTQQVA